MSSIFSCRPLKRINRAFLALSLALLPAIATAETIVIRLYPRIFEVKDGIPPDLTVSRLTELQGEAFQGHIQGFEDCAEIVTGPIYDGKPRDTLRDTWTVIQTFRVGCWALLMQSPEALVTPVTEADRITPEMIDGIMAHNRKLSLGSEEWAKALLDFQGGEIACKTVWRCRLSRLDGQTPPEQSVDFELMIATEDDHYIRVVQMIYGRTGFVYGVRWHESASGGEVLMIFPTFF